jgi:predicted ATPase
LNRLHEGFLALLTRLAQDAPVVLVVEDIHWAEQSTLDLLMFLTAALRTERVLVALTYGRSTSPAGRCRRRFSSCSAARR